MDEVLERGIQRCFPEHECIQKIVRREFLMNHFTKQKSKVDTLAFLAIKSIMRKELMKDETDVYSHYIYKLIYEEPIDDDWDDLCEKLDQQATESNGNDIAPDVENAQSRQLLSHRRIMTSIVKKFRNLFQCVSKPDVPERQTIPKTNSRRDHFHQIRSDGPMMYSILNQRLPRFYEARMDIILKRNTLQICLNRDYIVADIPHRDGIYDTFWAEKFTKTALFKFVDVVVLHMNGGRIVDDLMLNRQFMSIFLQTMIIDSLPRVIPPEGWRDYINETRPVYATCSGLMESENDYIIGFSRWDYYEPLEGNRYWGYLAED